MNLTLTPTAPPSLTLTFINIVSSLAQAVGAAEKVVKWIEREPTIRPSPNPCTPLECLGDLKLVDVTFRYALRPEKVCAPHLSHSAQVLPPFD